MTEPESRLSRRLGTADAVVVGVGAMVGTGVFVVWAPAAGRAGGWLLAGLAIAAFVAYCNATSSAALAAIHPQAGGTYVYGRERLGHGWGALAGYAFVLGKVASCAAAAHAVGTYLWPAHGRLVAVVAVVAVTAVNLAGVHRTVGATRWLLVAVLGVLTAVVIAGLVGATVGRTERASAPPSDVGPLDVLGAAALLFFAFAGYARIATLGEEVRDPARTIPRAVPLALGIVLVVYTAVGATVLLVLGAAGAAVSPRPVAAVAEAVDAGWLVPVVAGGAAVAALGALLALVAGVSRTVFAMADEGDLPRTLAAVHHTRRVPHLAEIVVGVAVIAAVLVSDLVAALSISAFAVLLYYAVANAAALRLRPDERRWPPWLAVAGLGSCLLLAASLPLDTMFHGTVALVVAMTLRAAVLARRRRASA